MISKFCILFLGFFQGCTKEEAIEYCTMKHGYLVEYQLVEEFEMVRSIIKESLGSYWFWVGTSYNEMNEYRFTSSLFIYLIFKYSLWLYGGAITVYLGGHLFPN